MRVIAPAHSLSIISEEIRKVAIQKFEELGLKVVFGKHAVEMDEFTSSSIKSRVDDLHEAFRSPDVKAVFTVIGGYNSNQLLKYIDWNLIENNPKIFCGYSDITALNNAIFAKTGLVNYSGPSFSSLGKILDSEYTLDHLKKCLFSDESFEIIPSEKWDDRKWWIDQKDRAFFENAGWLVINEGEAEGTLLGANLCTFNLLLGTEYFPDLSDSVLFLEDDEESKAGNFDRNLQSLLHQPEFAGVRGLVIGRFQKASEMTDEKLIKIIKTKKELENIPVIANVDFGHTFPMVTFPIGGTVKVKASEKDSKIEILEH